MPFWLAVALVLSCVIHSSAAPPPEARPAQSAPVRPPALPDPPVLVSPPNGSRTCNPRPVFIWDRVKQATYYHIQVDDDQAFGSPVIDQTTYLTSLTPESDLPIGTWHWRVRAASDRLAGSWSAPWSVIILPAPERPTLLSPVDGSQLCDRTPFLDWSTVSGSTSYRVQVDDDPDFRSPLLDERTSSSSYALSTDLAPGVYHWRVQARTDCGDGPWSAAFSFEIFARPLAPILLAPPDGSSTQERTPSFSWRGVSGAASYRIQVDNSRRFDSPLVDEEGADTSYVPTIGLPNGTYYWRVQAISVCESGDWSDPWSVTISNRPPIANDDQYSVDEDSPDRELDVLGNDRDPDGDTLSIVRVTQPLSGSVSIADTSDRLIYRPDPDYFGQDSFSYTVGDGHGDTDTATVALTVIGINDPPVADAGPDQSVLTSILVTLDGSRSYDPDGNLPLSYFWAQSGGPPVALSSGIAVSPTLVAPTEPCTLTFELIVIDALDEPGVAPDQTVVTVHRPVVHHAYLPTMVRDHIVAPDLVVQRIDATPEDVRVTIVNQGNAPVVDGFFVDLYVNPRSAPQAVNQTWEQFGAQGAVWGVTGPALFLLVPGGSVTLEVDDRYYVQDLSNLPSSVPAGTTLYAQADSFNPATSYGTVLEGHEIDGGTYNNVRGPVRSTAAVAGETTPLRDPGSYAR